MLKLLVGNINDLGPNVLLKELRQDYELTSTTTNFLEKAFQDPKPVIAFSVEDDFAGCQDITNQILKSITNFLFEYNSKREIYILGDENAIEQLNAAWLNKNQRRSFLISGRVQGVFYRQSTLEKATDLKLAGTVQNLENGSVYVEAQGSLFQLLSLFEWCLKGPDLAKVDRIFVKELDVVSNDNSFKVKR